MDYNKSVQMSNFDKKGENQNETHEKSIERSIGSYDDRICLRIRC